MSDSTNEALLQAIEAAPADPLPKLALADWHAERGHDVIAFAYRWAAQRERHPLYSRKTKHWRWGERRTASLSCGKPHELPRCVWREINPFAGTELESIWKRAFAIDRMESIEDAFRALAYALDRLRAEVMLDNET